MFLVHFKRQQSLYILTQTKTPYLYAGFCQLIMIPFLCNRKRTIHHPGARAGKPGKPLPAALVRQPFCFD
jgi:hypothetical protein